MMHYRAVGNLCAVDIDLLDLPLSHDDVLAVLDEQGFGILERDIVALARERIGFSRYRRGALPCEAPETVDCSSFVKWLYGQIGIWLPRYSIQQRELGQRVESCELAAGDLVFRSGYRDYYFDNPADGVGHVGIATDVGTVIHAANSKTNIIEVPFTQFIGNKEFRGARRYIPKDHTIVTLIIPPFRPVETADDIRWIVLQTL